jgi:hypothetical protein
VAPDTRPMTGSISNQQPSTIRGEAQSSLVGIPSRRAASVARSGSASIGSCCGIVEAEFTAEGADLVLDAHHDSKVTAVD